MIDELQQLIQKELAQINRLNKQKQAQITCQSVEKPITTQIETQSLQNKSKPITNDNAFRPMLSRKSLKMAEKLGDPLERLTRPKKSITPEIREINKKKSTSSHQAPRWEQLYTLNEFYKTKKEALRTQIELERSKENIATFQPDLTKSQLNYQDFSIPFDERLKYWEAKKNEKMQSILQEHRSDNQSVCTFKPKLYKAIKTEDIEVSEFSKKGLIQYFERIQQAQKQKEPLKQESKWRNKITIPQEFKLGRRR